MKKIKKYLTKLIMILLLILIFGIIAFYYGIIKSDGKKDIITNNNQFINKVSVEFNSLPQDDE